jgi:hypothetical protein
MTVRIDVSFKHFDAQAADITSIVFIVVCTALVSVCCACKLSHRRPVSAQGQMCARCCEHAFEFRLYPDSVKHHRLNDLTPVNGLSLSYAKTPGWFP